MVGLRGHRCIAYDQLDTAEAFGMELWLATEQAGVTIEETVGGFEGLDIEVDVEAAQAPQIKNTREIRAVNRSRQRLVQIQQRREFIADQGIVVRVGPEAILPIRVEALPALLIRSEGRRNPLVLPGLVNDLGKHRSTSR